MNKTWLPLPLLGLLAGLAALLIGQLEIDHRIDAFLPAPADARQAMAMDQIGSGTGGRLIFAAISGARPDRLSEASQQLADRWRSLESVTRVDNGQLSAGSELIELLMQHRFVLLPDVERRTKPEAVKAALQDRLSELALAGRQAREMVRADPLGLVPAIAEGLTPSAELNTINGIWLDGEGERALLLVVSAHPPFAVAEQAELIGQLRQQFDETDQGTLTLTLAGAPIITADSAERSRADALRLSLFGSLFLLAVLLWAWRSPLLLVAGAIPLASGVVCGLLAVAFLFDGRVHGLTLAFGFTLLGVALDYPVHLMTHSARRRELGGGNIRIPLFLGAASTVIAYLAVSASASPGLAQMGAFSAAGLAAAAVATLLLPRLAVRPPAYLPQRIRTGPRAPWLPAGAGLLALLVVVGLGPERWSNDLSRLSPVDSELLAADFELRQQLGGGDVRYLLMISDASLETTLQDTETLSGHLKDAVNQNLLSGWQAVTDLVPSRKRQQQRLAAWPSAERMTARLTAADQRFTADAFAPFIDALHQTNQASPPVTPATWQSTPLASRVDALLAETEHGWRSIIAPVGLQDPGALAEWLDRRDLNAELIDLRATSESMVAAWRHDAGLSLAVALVLIAGFLWIRTRKLVLTGRIMLPPLAATACVAAIMSVVDGGLTLVHLIGALLAAGVGLDFSLFANLRSAKADDALRTNHAINICALSTGGVFLILGQSDIGMLRMLGLTIALGVLLSWLFTRLNRPECP